MTEKSAPFSIAVAERLMRQLRDGLVGQSPEKFLAAFDRDATPDYATFSRQMQTFFDSWENIRVHYQITQAAAANCATACGTATVQFDMEAESIQSDVPAMRRGAQVQLTFQRGTSGWKIVNLSPRELFR